MKVFWLLCALMVMPARVASAGAGALNLSWNDCSGSPGFIGWVDHTFACNNNSATFTLVGSFVAPSSVNAASGIVGILDMQSFGVTLVPWWGMAPGLCREGSLSVNFDFTNGPGNCVDFWQGAASGRIVMDPPTGTRTRIRLVASLPAGSPLITSIPEGEEVYAFKILIDAARTTGLGACAGCPQQAVICLTSITVTQPSTAGGDRYIWQPAMRSWVTWQGADVGYVCFPDPVRNTTWGSIKTLYR